MAQTKTKAIAASIGGASGAGIAAMVIPYLPPDTPWWVTVAITVVSAALAAFVPTYRLPNKEVKE